MLPERIALNHKLLAWRDRHRLAVITTLNDAAVHTLREFDPLVPEAGWQGSWFDRESFAQPRLDGLMRGRVEKSFPPLIEAAVAELIALDRALEALAEELRLAVLSAISEPDKGIEEEKQAIEADSSGPADAPLEATSSGWDWLADVGRVTVSYVASAGEAAGSSLRYLTGVHDGLRRFAREHVVRTWLNADGEPPDVATRIDRTFNRIADNAREAVA